MLWNVTTEMFRSDNGTCMESGGTTPRILSVPNRTSFMPRLLYPVPVGPEARRPDIRAELYRENMPFTLLPDESSSDSLVTRPVAYLCGNPPGCILS
jgi:hypothetical protein